MDEANKYAVSALRERRAVMSGEIIALKKQIAWRKQQLEHLDASLRLFDPSYRANTVRPKRPMKRLKLFRQGELSRTILDVLREAGQPISTYQVVGAVLTALGHGEESRLALHARVRSNLQYLSKDRKAVIKSGRGRNVRWALA